MAIKTTLRAFATAAVMATFLAPSAMAEEDWVSRQEQDKTGMEAMGAFFALGGADPGTGRRSLTVKPAAYQMTDFSLQELAKDYQWRAAAADTLKDAIEARDEKPVYRGSLAQGWQP